MRSERRRAQIKKVAGMDAVKVCIAYQTSTPYKGLGPCFLFIAASAAMAQVLSACHGTELLLHVILTSATTASHGVHM